jgi:hypothetical protein
LRLGAKVLGPPAWDPDFNAADLPMLMRISDLPARYRKHFLGRDMALPAALRATPSMVRHWRPGEASSAMPWPMGMPRRCLTTSPTADVGERARYRAVFISDLHLGTPGCQARLCSISSSTTPAIRCTWWATSSMAGNCADAGTGRRPTTTWCRSCCAARKGCRVVFVPGNHDEFARQFIGHSFGGIEVANEAVHTTADGQPCGWCTATTSTA